MDELQEWKLQHFQKMSNPEWMRKDFVNFGIGAVLISFICYMGSTDRYTDDMGFHHEPSGGFAIGVIWTVAMYIMYRTIDSLREKSAKYYAEELKKLVADIAKSV